MATSSEIRNAIFRADAAVKISEGLEALRGLVRLKGDLAIKMRRYESDCSKLKEYCEAVSEWKRFNGLVHAACDDMKQLRIEIADSAAQQKQ